MVMSYEKKQAGAHIEVETTMPGPGGTIEARNIGPHGPTGPMHTVDPDYMRAIGPHGAEGPLEPMPTGYARAIGPHGGQGPLIPLEGVPLWERGQFTYGAGPFAPGGPGGGMTIGPGFRTPGQAPGPMSCPQVSNGSLVCVQAPFSPRERELPDREEPPYTGKGEVAGRGWPPEIGPQEEQMMEVGCVATGRRCGGSVRAPAQYWCCPQPGGMPMPFIGTPFPTGFGGLGALSDWLSGYRALMLATGVAALGYLFWKKHGRLPGTKAYKVEFQEMIGGKPMFNVTATKDGHIFGWVNQDEATGLWGVGTDMADVNMEGFSSKDPRNTWPWPRRRRAFPTLRRHTATLGVPQLLRLASSPT
jgi:hypothetical protein